MSELEWSSVARPSFLHTERLDAVHICGTYIVCCGPSVSKWNPAQRNLLATKWMVRIKFLMWTVSYTVIRCAKYKCNKSSETSYFNVLTEHLFTPVFCGEHILGDAGMDHWWNDTDEEKLKYRGKPCPIVTIRHKSYMTWPGTQPGLPQWQTGDWQPETWHSRLGEIHRPESTFKLWSVQIIQWFPLADGLYKQRGLKFRVLTF